MIILRYPPANAVPHTWRGVNESCPPTVSSLTPPARRQRPAPWSLLALLPTQPRTGRRRARCAPLRARAAARGALWPVRERPLSRVSTRLFPEASSHALDCPPSAPAFRTTPGRMRYLADRQSADRGSGLPRTRGALPRHHLGHGRRRRDSRAHTRSPVDRPTPVRSTGSPGGACALP